MKKNLLHNVVLMEARLFLRNFFRDYYIKNKIEAPLAIQQREFGVGFFGKKIAMRHLAFANETDFNRYLQIEVPFYISYSVAYYKFPMRRPMEAKELFGADLIYEFDADDIKTDCKLKHDKWHCPNCGEEGKGLIENCTNCGTAVETEQWVCDECLGAVKKQLFQLIDFLENDFGISEGISVNFSGHKGYHLHVRNEKIRELSPQARLEIINYLTATDFDPAARGYLFDPTKKRMVCPEAVNAIGWDKRIFEAIFSILRTKDASLISKAGNISLREAKELVAKNELIISKLKEGIMYPTTRKPEKFWLSIIEYTLSQLRLDIDRQTSADISKLIRVPNTIHGGSGLLAKTVPIDELKNFNPLEECVILTKKKINIHIKKTPSFKLLGEKFGPYENEVVELPEAVAVYLLAKGVAELT